MKKVNIFLGLAAVAVVAFGFIYQPSTDGAVKVTGNTGTNIGDKAPEIILKNPEGKEIRLSTVNKDMYVLIDFWASWCRPCRRENPAVVAAYKAYNGKKFIGGASYTVFSVSLDANPKDWTNAIAQDGLVWAHHGSDLKQWASDAAALYGVESIPTNFLVDNKGIIVAKNLRGEALEAELQKWAVK